MREGNGIANCREPILEPWGDKMSRLGGATDICISLGRQIRRLRKARGWRQIDLAEHSGINVVHISYIERGAKEICLRNLQVIAQTFEMTIRELLKGVK